MIEFLLFYVSQRISKKQDSSNLLKYDYANLQYSRGKNDIVSFFQTLIAIKPLEVSGEDASSTYFSNPQILIAKVVINKRVKAGERGSQEPTPTYHTQIHIHPNIPFPRPTSHRYCGIEEGGGVGGVFQHRWTCNVEGRGGNHYYRQLSKIFQVTAHYFISILLHNFSNKIIIVQDEKSVIKSFVVKRNNKVCLLSMINMQ